MKEKVKHCLEIDEESRNSDIRLLQVMWWEYNRDKFVDLPDGTKAIRVKDFFDLPREDHISRVHRAIQEEAMKKLSAGLKHYVIYLPTSAEVVKQRKINEINWREYVGLK